MLQMGDTVDPRYTAPKISAISYLFRTFSLLIMGDTERPRYTGFRGLSVRGITALQCTNTAHTKRIHEVVTYTDHTKRNTRIAMKTAYFSPAYGGYRSFRV